MIIDRYTVTQGAIALAQGIGLKWEDMDSGERDDALELTVAVLEAVFNDEVEMDCS